MNRPAIIGLCGHMGVGKDAAAALLSMAGYRRVAFADEVRAEVQQAIRRHDIPSSAPQSIAQDISRAKLDEVWSKPTDIRMRRILQWWGVEYRRAQDPDYWVKRAAERIHALTVVSDVRFPSEVAMLRDRGAVIWKIDRDVVIDGIPGHSSESAVKEISPDLVIDNRGTLIELAAKLMAALGGE